MVKIHVHTSAQDHNYIYTSKYSPPPPTHTHTTHTHTYTQAELRGKKGFVPSNFLEKVLPDRKGRDGEGLDVFAADADSMRQAETLFNVSSFHLLLS